MNKIHNLSQVQMHKNQIQPDMAVYFHQDNGGLMRCHRHLMNTILFTYWPMKEDNEWLMDVRHDFSDSSSCL